MESQQKLRNATIMAYFQPQRKNENGGEAVNSSKSLQRTLSPASRKISRKSLKQLQPTAERTGLTGRSTNKGVKKRKHTEDTEADPDCKRQATKVQRIVPIKRAVTVYKDPVSKPCTPATDLTDKENVCDPRDSKQIKEICERPTQVKSAGRPEVKDGGRPEVKGEGRPEVKEGQSEVSAAASSGDCSCNCHQKADSDELKEKKTPEGENNRQKKECPTEEDAGGKKKEQTPEEEAWELMGQEEITPAYWEQLAERRREALAEALKENEDLHKEVSDLKDENSRLSEMANQAEYFANMLKLVTGENEEEQEADSDQDTGSDKQQEQVKEVDSGLDSSLPDQKQSASVADSDDESL